MKCITEFMFLAAGPSKIKAVIAKKFTLKNKRVISEALPVEAGIPASKKLKRTLLPLTATQTISKSRRTHLRKLLACADDLIQASVWSGESIDLERILLGINANIAQMS
jgi:hypothetical protein